MAPPQGNMFGTGGEDLRQILAKMDQIVSALREGAAGDLSVNVSLAPGMITLIIDGGGATIATGVKADVGPFAIPLTLTACYLLADQTGSVVFGIWKDTYANFPPTGADSITGAAPPTISAAVKSADLTLTGWTTTVAVGDILRFNIASVTSIQRVTLTLFYTR